MLYGILIGILCGVFRIFGSSADSVSYAVVIGNMVTPLIDEISVPVPYGCRKQKEEGEKRFPIPKAAVILCVITLIAGVCLSGVHEMTAETIAEQQLAASAASYKEVCPGKKGAKALDMQNMEANAACQSAFDYAVTLPEKADVIAKFKEAI